MKAVLDVGALVGVDRRDRRVGAMLRILQQRRIPLWTSAAVVAQVWRDDRRQALLANLLGGVGVRPLTSDDARRGVSFRLRSGPTTLSTPTSPY